MRKFTSIPPALAREQTCTSFSSLATQGCQFDKCIDHSSSRKPTNVAHCFNPPCPSAQWGSPLAAVSTGNSMQAVTRGMCRGYQAICYPYSVPPELRQSDCFLTHSCTCKLRIQFCSLIQTLIFQSIQRGRLHSWATSKGSMFSKPMLGTARDISVLVLASFSPRTVTEGRTALWEMRQGGDIKIFNFPLCTGPQASEIGSKTISETVRALHIPFGRQLDINHPKSQRIWE